MAKRTSDSARLAEIVAILRRHQLTKGLTPEKVRAIFEDLGATYVKFGQILSMRPDLLPAEYCRALESLRTDVAPMPMETVYEILTAAYHRPWREVFAEIEPQPLGSASIAQAHAATLRDGRRCVIKVQRPGLWDTMERDVRLLKKGAGVLRYTPMGSAVDFCDVLDHLWRAAQEEMDFTLEARNLAEFKAANADVKYADCPATIDEWCTRNVLMMEYIGGRQIDDGAGLTADGYDRKEIATKLVYNYIEQITRYRFFHADPHPGNIRVMDGKIYWLDLGMMGRLTAREAELYITIIRTINDGDAMGLTDALLDISDQADASDRLAISESVGALFRKYEVLPMAEMDMGEMVEEFIAMLNQHGLALPTGLTMLGRSLIVIQGTLVGIDPEVNVVEIVAHYMAQETLTKAYLEQKLKELGRGVARSGAKLALLPAQVSEFLGKANAGNLVVNWKKVASESEYAGQYKLLNRLILAILDAALLLAAAITATASALPKLLGLPWPSPVLFLMAAAVTMKLVLNGKRMK